MVVGAGVDSEHGNGVEVGEWGVDSIFEFPEPGWQGGGIVHACPCGEEAVVEESIELSGAVGDFQKEMILLSFFNK